MTFSRDLGAMKVKAPRALCFTGKESKVFTFSCDIKYDRQGPIASFHTDICPLGVFFGTLQNAFNFGTLVRLTHLSWRVFLSNKKS